MRVIYKDNNIMSFRTIMGNIGNAFKTGFQNGNLAKAFSTIGATATTVGLTGMMIHDMKNSNSGGCCGGSIFNGYFSNPYCGMGMMGMGYNNMYGMNSMNTYMGNMMAYQYGQQVVQQIAAQQGAYAGGAGAAATTTILTDEQIEAHKPGYNNVDAGAIPAGIDNSDVASGLEDILNNTGDKKIKIGDKYEKTNKDAYVTKVKELAQGFIRQINSSANNITEDDFITYMQGLYSTKYSAATDAQKDAYNKEFKNLFVQMDLNGDGHVDWKEMASSLATMDAGGGYNLNNLDGEISQNDFNASLTAAKNGGRFGSSNKNNYATLFGTPATE